MNMQSRRGVFQTPPFNPKHADPLLTLPQPTYVHAQLWLDKYLAAQERKADQPSSQKTDSTGEKKDEKSRSRLVREVAALPIPEIYQEFYERWEKSLKSFGARRQLWCAKGRIILGLGIESVIETSITLHRTYGVPYLPASALKGIASSYLRWQFGENWRKEKEKCQQYETVFGNTNSAGYVTFFDALYVPGRTHQGHALQQDVIAVHHPDYYAGSKTGGGKNTHAVPADSDDPNPVSFLSATGYYLIALAAPDLQEKDAWIQFTFDILEQALQHWGIGAKTSSGYGRMERVPGEP